MARVLLTGPPGSGKTTLTLRVVQSLRDRGEQLAGFTTSEIRRGGRRTGFLVTGVGSGLERRLAVRASAEGGPLSGPGAVRVGSYAVDVAAFEEVALLEIENALELGTTLVVDEIGKMELASEAFRALLPRIFEAPRLLATVRANADPAIQELKEDLTGRNDVLLVDVRSIDRSAAPPGLAELVLGDRLAERR